MGVVHCGNCGRGSRLRITFTCRITNLSITLSLYYYCYYCRRGAIIWKHVAICFINVSRVVNDVKVIQLVVVISSSVQLSV